MKKRDFHNMLNLTFFAYCCKLRNLGLKGFMQKNKKTEMHKIFSNNELNKMIEKTVTFTTIFCNKKSIFIINMQKNTLQFNVQFRKKHLLLPFLN
jgi:hypothetical protein